MRSFLVLFLVAVAGCGVSRDDAHQMAQLLQLTATVDRATQDRLLLRGCSEISSCAGSCQRAFEAAATVDPADAGTLIAACSSDLRRAHDANPSLKAIDWFRGSYLAAYSDRVEKVLAPADLKPFRAARFALGFPSSR